MDVASWLCELGLECYVATFASNNVTPDILPQLSSDDLKELGVVSVGHRRLLLGAIGKSRDGMTTDGTAQEESSPPSSSSLAGIDEGERRHLTVMFCVDSTAPAPMRGILVRARDPGPGDHLGP